MSEAAAIALAQTPATVETLVRDLIALGVRPGLTLLAHSSLSKLGYVVSGPPSVILALEQALGPEGTLVMPTHSSELSEPSYWRHPAVPAEWWDIIRDNMPAFDPDLTPTRGMGAIPECFRKQRGVVRSQHPQDSFAARGPQAERITAHHALADGLGEQSPLARLYDLEGWALLLGVGYGNNTSLHLAEVRANFPGKKTQRQGAPILVDGVRQWVEFEALDWHDEDFERLGADFARDTGLERTGRVALAEARLMPQRALVDYAVRWMEQNRK
jgi:aminoglycoside 3-N-acetyltransferase